MRVLYGVQGTGHGHISRAKVIVPLLREHADVDVLISGYNYNLNIDGEIAFQKRGLSLAYDKKGSVDFVETALKLNPAQFFKDVAQVPVKDYDFVISDFEPVTAWGAQKAGLNCVGLSHQAAFLSKKTPRPEKKSYFSERVLKHFAPCNLPMGTHYRRYDSIIEPPILRPILKTLTPTNGEHITVYLPAFDHETLCSILSRIPDIKWDVFSPTCTHTFSKGNVKVNPIGNESFLKSFENCEGLVCSAGFEAPSEAMFLGKKLLVIPIKNQYEQLCNAVALEKLGVSVIYDITSGMVAQLREWLRTGKMVKLPEICNVIELIPKILRAGIKECELVT